MDTNTRYKKHIPFHLYLENQIYFVTAGTLKKKPYFDTDNKKEILKSRLKSACSKFKIKLYAWVILSNHYHILFCFKEQQNLRKLIGFINGGSSFELNTLQ